MSSKTIFLATLLLIQALSTYVILEDGQPYCMTLPTESSSNQHHRNWKFYYDVTSDEQEVQVNTVIQTFEDQKSLGSITLTGQQNSSSLDSSKFNQVCFQPKTDGLIYVLFQFYHEKHQDLKQLLLKSELFEIHDQLIDFGDKMYDIAQNEKLFEQRQMIHGDMIIAYENKLWIWTILKVIIVMGAILGQIIFFRRLISKYPQK